MIAQEIDKPNPEGLQVPVPGGKQTLGQLAITEGAESLDHPVIDIALNAIEPAVYAPAEAAPYIGTAKRGLEIYEGPDQTTQATKYAEDLFPDSHFSLLGTGRYGIVLADETGKAFKIYRTAHHYSTYEREVGALQLLSEAGLAPKVHLFVDAGEEYRIDVKAHDYTKKGFEDVQIPRQNSGRELPVLVMDRIDATPLESAEPDKIADGFSKAATVFIENNITAWDCEVEVDRQTGNVIFLDVGGLSQTSFDAENATPEAKMKHAREILRYLALDFGLTNAERQIQLAYEKGGIDGIRVFLTSYRQPAR